MAAAEDLALSAGRRHDRADHHHAERVVGAGPGRGPADDLLAPGASSSSGPGVGGDSQPVPDSDWVSDPQPKKRPKSSCIRFQADRPNERWQSGFIHWQLAGGREAEIVSWLDDHSRYALSITACLVTTGEVTLATFRAAVAAHGTPAATLTDNGLVCTTRFAGRPAAMAWRPSCTAWRPAEERPPQPYLDPGQGRAVPADPAEMTPLPAARRHPHPISALTSRLPPRWG